MGEQPLFSCKAHVFQLEPEMKKSWIALSTTAVNVQIFHDPIKNIYRIVSVEGTKALINSIVTPKMTFTKTSQKFGQWIDFKLNLVYGLGFANDVELNKFVEKFKEIKELTRSTGGTLLRPHERSNSCEINSMNRTANSDQNESSAESQLRHENERLRMALNQAMTSTRKFEDEIQSLKTANLRLTSAVQESQSNVDEWKRQMIFYKEEYHRLKNNSPINNLNSEIEVVVSSSSSLNHNHNHHLNNIGNLKPSLKHEFLKLADSFDRKFNELDEIRNQLRVLIDEMSSNF